MPSAASCRSTTTWVAMPAWSVPGSQSVLKPVHALPADQDVLQRVVERVAHVQRAGDVRRRDAVSPPLKEIRRPPAPPAPPGSVGWGGRGGLSPSFGVFTFLLLIDRIFDLMDLIINKGVPVHLVLHAPRLHLLPASWSSPIPIGFLFAILVAFGRLSADMEIVALKACGVSLPASSGSVVAFGVVVAGVTGYLMIDSVPKTNYAFKSLVFDIVRTQATVGLKERVFNDTFGNFVIYVDEIASDQVALGTCSCRTSGSPRSSGSSRRGKAGCSRTR